MRPSIHPICSLWFLTKHPVADGGAKARKRLAALEEALHFVRNPVENVERALASMAIVSGEERKATPTRARPAYSVRAIARLAPADMPCAQDERAELNHKSALVPNAEAINRSLEIENERDPVHRFMRPPLKLIPGEEAEQVMEAAFRVSLATASADGDDGKPSAAGLRRRAERKRQEEEEDEDDALAGEEEDY